MEQQQMEETTKIEQAAQSELQQEDAKKEPKLAIISIVVGVVGFLLTLIGFSNYAFVTNLTGLFFGILAIWEKPKRTFRTFSGIALNVFFALFAVFAYFAVIYINDFLREFPERFIEF